jgi:hypothetical protein
VIETLRAFWPTLALLAVFTAFFLLLRNRSSSASSLEGITGGRMPAVVELFSNL